MATYEAVTTRIFSSTDAPETHLGDDRKLLHAIPVWLVDVPQRLRQALGRLVHGFGRARQNSEGGQTKS